MDKNLPEYPWALHVLRLQYFSGVLVSLLSGVIAFQTYAYLTTFTNDRRLLRGAILFVCIVVIVRACAINYRHYTFNIGYFGRIAALLAPFYALLNEWSFLLVALLSAFADVIVRAIFTVRIWQLCKNHPKLADNKPLAALISGSSFIAFAMGIATPLNTVRLIRQAMANPQQDLGVGRFGVTSWPFLVYLLFTMISYSAISATLCFLLYESIFRAKRKSHPAVLFVTFMNNTGLLATLLAWLGFLTYVVAPSKMWYYLPFCAVPALGFSAILSNLNCRKPASKRNPSMGVISISLSGVSRDIAFKSSAGTGTSDTDDTVPRQTSSGTGGLFERFWRGKGRGLGSGNQGSGNQGSSNQRPSNQEPSNQVSSTQGSSNQETSTSTSSSRPER